jgi:hypothetical protein
VAFSTYLSVHELSNRLPSVAHGNDSSADNAVDLGATSNHGEWTAQLGLMSEIVVTCPS